MQIINSVKLITLIYFIIFIIFILTFNYLYLEGDSFDNLFYVAFVQYKNTIMNYARAYFFVWGEGNVALEVVFYAISTPVIFTTKRIQNHSVICRI